MLQMGYLIILDGRSIKKIRLLVVVSTSQPEIFVMTAYRALIRPSGEDAMGRSCILDSHPGRWILLRASALPRASTCLGGNPECNFCPWRPPLTA